MAQIIKGYVRIHSFDLDLINLVYTDLHGNEKFIKILKDVWSALFEMYS
jgi:hypothetical protein